MARFLDTVNNFETAFEVRKVDDSTYEGIYPLKFPIPAARGVYGGHLCAQALYVGIKSAKGFVPTSFNSYFISAGTDVDSMTYNIVTSQDTQERAFREIKVTQGNQVRYICLISFKKQHLMKMKSNLVNKDAQKSDILLPMSVDHFKKVYSHTDYVKTAVEDSFFKYEIEESRVHPTDRWLTVCGSLKQPKQFSDQRFNFVGLADISDSVILTTLARILHLPWNPTKEMSKNKFEKDRNALKLIDISMNILHIFHYNAMSLDHNLYFHCDNFDSFDITKEWLTLKFQLKHLSNNRALIKGYFLNEEGKCLCTIVQEGLVHFLDGVGEQIKFPRL